MTISHLKDIFNLIAGILVSVGGIGVVLYFILQKTLEAHFARRLEQTKHDLQLEQQRMSIVYEHQKDSFRDVLVAMNRALKSVADNWDDGEWSSVTHEVGEAFQEVVSQEGLFMDKDSDHALELFKQAIWSATSEPYSGPPESDDVSRAHAQMTVITERMAEHFRIRVGLHSPDSKPLQSVYRLGAIVLINRFHFPEFDFPTKTSLTWKKDRRTDGKSIEELIAIAEHEPQLLRSELLRLKEAMVDRGGIFFKHIAEVELYLNKLQ